MGNAMNPTASNAAPAKVAGRFGSVAGVAWLLAALCIVFSLEAPGFLSGANLVNVLLQATILLLLALPMTLIILTEGLDLSMGAALSLSTVVLAGVQIGTGSLML